MNATYDPALYATDRRTLVFVDAGFLLNVMRAHHQVTDRSSLVIDHPALVQLLREGAEHLLGCPVLRIYWYDAAHPSARVPNLLAAEMARVDGVRVRLGTLNIRPDGRYEQKAVDTLLVRDMIVHAYQRTAQEMMLLSGDNDLIPGVEEAQEQGVRVHLWSIRGDDLPPSVGRRLSELADSRQDLEASHLAKAIGAESVADVGEPAAEPAPDHDDADEGAPTGSADTDAIAAPAQARPTPAMIARSVSPANLAASIRAQTPGVYARTEDDAFARLYDVDRDAYHAPVPGDDSLAVGMAYAARWAAAVPAEVLTAIRERHEPGFDGNIPKQIDSDLLYFGSDHGLDTWAQLEKFKLRRGFWQGILADVALHT